MAKKNLSQYEIVCNQVKNLYLAQLNISIINAVSIPNIASKEIGKRTETFSHLKYPELYIKMLENSEYNILLNDESIISFFYTFNEDGTIKHHNLSFIPSLDIEICREDSKILENQVIISKQLNNYLRMDYHLEGKKEIIHTDSHLHFGLYPSEEELNNSELRIPMEGVIFPYEFMYIVLKYLYLVNNKDLEFLLENNYEKTPLLEECEKDKLLLTFNRNNYISK